MKIDPRFKDTEFVVEADSYARQSLWEKFSTEAMHRHPETNKYRWEQDCMGFMTQVGTVADMPVTVEFFWYKIEGHLILFYTPISQVVDHRLVETWLKKYCNPQYDHRRAHCDASNFHHVLGYIWDCEAKELLDQANAHAEAGNPDDAAQLLVKLTSKYPYKYEKEADSIAKDIKGMKKHPGVNLEKLRKEVKEQRR